MKTIDVVMHGIKAKAVEKDTYVILGTAIKHIATWCPKSLVRVDEESDENDITFVCDYGKAMEIAEAIQECFE